MRTERLPEANVGDWLLIGCAGAYAFVMGSNYNAKPQAAEVLVVRGKPYLVRARETPRRPDPRRVDPRPLSRGGRNGDLGIDITLLRDACANTLSETDFAGLGTRIEGKVRDSYVADGRARSSSPTACRRFDRVFGTIPLKGQVLNQTRRVLVREDARARAEPPARRCPTRSVSVARECTLLPVEFVVRGYLTGIDDRPRSGSATRRGDRLYCGHALPEGLRKHEPLADRAAHAHHEGASRRARRADVAGRDRRARRAFGRALRARRRSWRSRSSAPAPSGPRAAG